MEEEKKEGAPAWMVSFGDMMTLILTFFILLVSMSRERQVGLVAKGVGSFLVATRSFGLPGLMEDGKEASIFENVRNRFNLPPEDDPDKQSILDASNLELIRAKAAEALKPHDEFNQPGIATFEPDSSELTDSARAYLDVVALTLRPVAYQVLLIEGHSNDAGPRHRSDDRWLAFRRARAVADYLIEEHDFPPRRLEARAWVTEISRGETGTRSVDARLITPSK